MSAVLNKHFDGAEIPQKRFRAFFVPQAVSDDNVRVKYGLCCISLALGAEKIGYRKMTFKSFSSLPREAAEEKLSLVRMSNSRTLRAHIDFCAERKIARYRIPSGIFPLATHPTAGVPLSADCRFEGIKFALKETGEAALKNGVGLSFHPSQFVSIASARREVRINSAADINFNSDILDLLEVPPDPRSPINIHLNSRPIGFDEFERNFAEGLALLSPRARARLTIENEDRGFWNAKNLLDFLRPFGIPATLDLHHDSLNPSGVPVKKLAAAAAETWKPFTPVFHISEGNPANPRKHADFCSAPPPDLGVDCVFMVEAKAKDYAIEKLSEIE